MRGRYDASAPNLALRGVPLGVIKKESCRRTHQVRRAQWRAFSAWPYFDQCLPGITTRWIGSVLQKSIGMSCPFTKVQTKYNCFSMRLDRARMLLTLKVIMKLSVAGTVLLLSALELYSSNVLLRL